MKKEKLSTMLLLELAMVEWPINLHRCLVRHQRARFYEDYVTVYLKGAENVWVGVIIDYIVAKIEYIHSYLSS